MNELEIKLEEMSPKNNKKRVQISVKQYVKEDLFYKFLIGSNGKWRIIKEFGKENSAIWMEDKKGDYIVMVQAKRKNSTKSFNFIEKMDYTINSLDFIENAKITSFYCLTENISLGEELIFTAEVEGNSKDIVYKFIKIDDNNNCVCLQEFTDKNLVIYKEKVEGNYKLYCIAKHKDSKNYYDDMKLIEYSIEKMKSKECEFYEETETNEQDEICEETEINEQSGIYEETEMNEQNEIYEQTEMNEQSETYEQTEIDEDCGYGESIEESTEYRDTVGELAKEQVIEDISEEIEELEELGKVAQAESQSIKKFENEETIEAIKGMEQIERLQSSEEIKEIKQIQEKEKIQEKEEIEEKEEIVLNNSNLSHNSKNIQKYELHEELSNNQQCEEDTNVAPRINHILTERKNSYIVGEGIAFNIIASPGPNILTKYKIFIDGNMVEEIEYIEGNAFQFIPRCKGEYEFEFSVKNKEGIEQSSKSYNLTVEEASPIHNLNLNCDKKIINVNEALTFYVKAQGGKNVVYQFLIMKDGGWKLAQEYSRKDYYTFIPYSYGSYKILVLAKSYNKEIDYEDFCIFQFNVVKSIGMNFKESSDS